MKLSVFVVVFFCLICTQLESAKAQQSERRARMERRRQMQEQMRGQNNRRRNGTESGLLKVGDVAPTFTLKSLDGKSETELASFKGKKPVVLLFGSYT